MKSATIKKMTTIGMLLALQLAAGRFITISLPTVKIGFSFLPIAITAILYGPMWGAATAAMGDILLALLGPYGYYPPMTITALLTGALYGLLLYRKPANTVRVTICVVLQSVLLGLLLQTYWLSLLTGKGYLAYLPSRVLQNLVTIPLHIFCIRFIGYRLVDAVEHGGLRRKSTL